MRHTGNRIGGSNPPSPPGLLKAQHLQQVVVQQRFQTARVVQTGGTMPLSMARPWKHPKTDVYWLRKGVPEALRPLVGKREEKRSLKTRDPDEARQRHAQALSEVEAQWANLRSGPRPRTER